MFGFASFQFCFFWILFPNSSFETVVASLLQQAKAVKPFRSGPDRSQARLGALLGLSEAEIWKPSH